MQVQPSALAAAHDELTAAVAELAPQASRQRNLVQPSDDLIYRHYQRTPYSPRVSQALGRIASALAHQIEAEGYTVATGTMSNGAMGRTNHLAKTVTIDPNLREDRAVGTMIHELAHIRLRHFDRRMSGGDLNAEVEAESVAYVVGRIIGLNCAGFCAPYVANWSHGEMERLAHTRRNVLHIARAILEDL